MEHKGEILFQLLPILILAGLIFGIIVIFTSGPPQPSGTRRYKLRQAPGTTKQLTTTIFFRKFYNIVAAVFGGYATV